MMKLFFSFYLSLFFLVGNAQQKSVQSLSAEFGKNGLVYNAIYDYQFSKSQFGFRAGAGSNFAKYLSAVTITAGGYKLFGPKNSFFELGLDIQYHIIH